MDKDKLTQVAYEKSFNATHELLAVSANRKIEMIATYFLENINRRIFF